MAIEIVDFPIKNGGSFDSFLYVYQIYYPKRSWKISGGAMELPSDFGATSLGQKGGATNIWNGLAEGGSPPVGGGFSRPIFFGIAMVETWKLPGLVMTVTLCELEAMAQSKSWI